MRQMWSLAYGTTATAITVERLSYSQNAGVQEVLAEVDWHAARIELLYKYVGR